MKTNIYRQITLWALVVVFSIPAAGQVKSWTLEECISYALKENISVRKADISTNIGQINLEQARNNRLPGLSSSIGQTWSWQHSNADTVNTGTNLSLSSGITLFSGFELRNNIRRAEINYEALKYDSETTREYVSLSLLKAYLEVLYAGERVTISSNQVAATEKEMELAGERLRLGSISNADYLQVKAQLASDRQTLASSVNTLAMDKVTLMQLMELPVSDTFEIMRPDIDSLLSPALMPPATEVYSTALEVKSEVKSAALGTRESEVSLALARAGYYPTVSMNAGISTGLSGYDRVIVTGPLTDRLSTSVGVTVSIPIFSRWSNRSSVSAARANITMAQLNETDVKNQLRKDIEQACLDAVSASNEYEAAQFSYESASESYTVATEKFRQGVMNYVDFLTVKNAMTAAESSLLQAKYQLVFSRKIIDFYRGIPLSL